MVIGATSTLTCATDSGDMPSSIDTSTGVVTKDDIEEIVARWTGVPMTAIREEEVAKLLRIEEELHRRVISQEKAISAIKKRHIPMNIDGITAVIFCELGFEPELGRGLFILSRSVGILAHAWEQSQEGRRIKGPMSPDIPYRYTGPASRRLEDSSLTTAQGSS